MRTAARRRTALAATTLTMAALVTACGGGEDGKSGTEGSAAASTPSAAPTSGAAPATPAAKALSAAELEELMVADGDLKGYKVEEPRGTVRSAGVILDKDACKPIADALFAIPHHLAFASVERQAVAAGAPMTTVSLGSFEGNNTKDVLPALKASATACAGGFTVSVLMDEMRIRSVAPMTVAGGEEVLAWKVKAEVSAGSFVTSVVVSRTGNTMASFSTTSPARFWDMKQGQAVIDAQVAKLG